MINFTSSGVALYNRLIIIELSPTLFPVPVAPAMSRCGILSILVATGWPRRSLPSPRVRRESDWTNSFEETISRRLTISRCSLGISMPTTSRPGMGATIRMEMADNARAKSSERPTIFDSLIPGAGRYSKVVITGPGRISTTSPRTLKSLSLPSRILAFSWSISVSILRRIFAFSSRKAELGQTKSGCSRMSRIVDSAVYSVSSVCTSTMVGARISSRAKPSPPTPASAFWACFRFLGAGVSLITTGTWAGTSSSISTSSGRALSSSSFFAFSIRVAFLCSRNWETLSFT